MQPPCRDFFVHGSNLAQIASAAPLRPYTLRPSWVLVQAGKQPLDRLRMRQLAGPQRVTYIVVCTITLRGAGTRNLEERSSGNGAGAVGGGEGGFTLNRTRCASSGASHPMNRMRPKRTRTAASSVGSCACRELTEDRGGRGVHEGPGGKGLCLRVTEDTPVAMWGQGGQHGAAWGREAREAGRREVCANYATLMGPLEPDTTRAYCRGESPHGGEVSRSGAARR